MVVPYSPLRFAVYAAMMTTTGVTVKYGQTSHRRSRRASRGVLLRALAILLPLLFGAVAFIAYVLWPRWPEPPIASDAPSLPITIGHVAFNVPPAAMRVPLQRVPGAHDRVDLAFLWPSLEPPDPAQKSNTSTPAAPAATIERVFVTIAIAGDALSPAERVQTIYPRYAATTPAAGPPGLAVLAFRSGTPYESEDLIYDAATPNNFLVRCSRNGAGPTPGTCLYERRIESADVVVRFPRDWLDDWQEVAANIERLITNLRPAAH
jgi:hypothetical protein